MSVLEMSAVPVSFHMATLFEHVADPTSNGIGIVSPEAMLPSLPSVVTAPPLVSPSPEVRVKLLVNGDPESIDASSPAASDESPAVLSNASPMSMLVVPALFGTAMLFGHVADPAPDGIGMESLEAMLPLLPSIVTAPLLMSPSPKVRVKLLVDGDPEAIGASPPAASDESPAILSNNFPMLVPEMPAVPALFHTATLVEHVADPMPDGIWMELPEAMLPYRPCHQLSQLLRLCCPLPRAESSCWLMVVQKWWMCLLLLLPTSCQPFH